jgi:hypothetical protein
MTDGDERLRALEARLHALEDRLALYDLIASYPLAADSGSGALAASLWTEDGTYDAQVGEWSGRADIASLFEGEMHRGLMDGGCGHVLSLPRIVVDGDRAVMTSHGRLYVRDGDSFRVWRVTATRWELERTPEGWKVTRRVNRVLDGTAEPQLLLRQGLDG